MSLDQIHIGVSSYALGSDVARSTNVRMIFATHCDLDSLQNSGEFRQDLFFRLRTHHVHIPPLRDRLDDLELLLVYFLEEASVRLQKNKPACPRELPILLATYNYPGNVRELQSIVFDALLKHGSRTLSMDIFKEYIENRRGKSVDNPKDLTGETVFSVLGVLPTLKESSKIHVKEALHRAQGNQAIAAAMLGVMRQALNWRLKKQQESE